ncbi:MAG: hypothetical protein ACYC9O_13830 [Candidatus Latescibacterota bacterium]
MPDTVYVFILLVTFLAYIVKALTGFGTAIVFVALGALLVGTREAVILCAVIDVIGGAGHGDRVRLRGAFASAFPGGPA